MASPDRASLPTPTQADKPQTPSPIQPRSCSALDDANAKMEALRHQATAIQRRAAQQRIDRLSQFFAKARTEADNLREFGDKVYANRVSQQLQAAMRKLEELHVESSTLASSLAETAIQGVAEVHAAAKLTSQMIKVAEALERYPSKGDMDMFDGLPTMGEMEQEEERQAIIEATATAEEEKEEEEWQKEEAERKKSLDRFRQLLEEAA